ncbi:hypothetical protein GCM10009555_024080 [Acrocarpospora macrocephala]|uniref:Uncharacterized protein n=1 Tax=Acrocarpospora macrocephala TaxID=150177 RepID=A0A5M3WUH5_9ACTN|nr:hypothetical protein [Acrocarpospora macrocephala]GES12340.1 hypothetical protein Amac_059370 [Acrocarpospora macrocephala]
MSNDAKAAGLLLRRMLTERAEYRAKWQYQQKRRSSSDMNRTAVAEVITQYLWAEGERHESKTARHMKDRVGRALAGQVMSPETLEWFITAFEMPTEDQRMLEEAYLHGMLPTDLPPADTLQKRQSLPRPQRHRTMMAFERRTIDVTGRAASHHSLRTIIACEDGVDRYPCFLSPRMAGIRVIHGGRVVTPYRPPVIEIALARSLREGETTSLEYRRDFEQIGGVDTEYRRVANGRAQNLGIVVQFHPHRLPSKVWWATWDAHRGGNVVEEQPVSLDADHRAHRFLPYMKNAAAGFHWVW